ncbi:MAG TPA: CoA transferase [Streptosporangiaceae bacterium]|nr:CoA transferase [Streptosporangiaceae bacterium]
MTGYELAAACLTDPRQERERLALLLPPGVLAADRSSSPAAAGDPARCAVLAWARSGLMHLTGLAAGPPLAPTAPVLLRAGAVATAITDLSGALGRRVEVDLNHLLAFRASLAGWSRRGTVSANGTCRILRAADGWLAVNLARPSDVECLPALLRRALRGEPWAELAAHAEVRPAASLAAAAQVLGIPAAPLAGPVAGPVRISELGPAGQAPAVVLDLSAMWAGPLCARVLRLAGLELIKVEDVSRPDGARTRLPAFYAELHKNAQDIAVDFGTPRGRAELARLADSAGVVIEASRPRALRRLGLIAEEWLASRPGRVWVSVTGYGRDDPQHRVAFGDDAAAAGGLVACTRDGTPVFCGDAIADPLTGLYAALAALASRAAGGGRLVDVAMAGVCAELSRPAATPPHDHEVFLAGAGWTVSHAGLSQQVVAA